VQQIELDLIPGFREAAFGREAVLRLRRRMFEEIEKDNYLRALYMLREHVCAAQKLPEGLPSIADLITRMSEAIRHHFQSSMRRYHSDANQDIVSVACSGLERMVETDEISCEHIAQITNTLLKMRVE
jgi:hypothetical protein